MVEEVAVEVASVAVVVEVDEEEALEEVAVEEEALEEAEVEDSGEEGEEEALEEEEEAAASEVEDKDSSQTVEYPASVEDYCGRWSKKTVELKLLSCFKMRHQVLRIFVPFDLQIQLLLFYDNYL